MLKENEFHVTKKAPPTSETKTPVTSKEVKVEQASTNSEKSKSSAAAGRTKISIAENSSSRDSTSRGRESASRERDASRRSESREVDRKSRERDRLSREKSRDAPDKTKVKHISTLCCILFLYRFVYRCMPNMSMSNFRKRSESMKCTREALWNVIPGIGIQHPKVEMAENKCLLQIQDEPQQSPQMIKVHIHDFAAGL